MRKLLPVFRNLIGMSVYIVPWPFPVLPLDLFTSWGSPVGYEDLIVGSFYTKCLLCFPAPSWCLLKQAATSTSEQLNPGLGLQWLNISHHSQPT